MILELYPEHDQEAVLIWNESGVLSPKYNGSIMIPVFE